MERLVQPLSLSSPHVFDFLYLTITLPDFVGKVEEASTLFNKMQEDGIKPGQVGQGWIPNDYGLCMIFFIQKLGIHFLVLVTNDIESPKYTRS